MVEPPRQFAQEEVEALLERHLAWLELEGEDGERANLQGAYLWQVNFQDAVLRQADLRSASLVEADPQRADLRGADLGEASFVDAQLQGADLREVRGLTQDQLNEACGDEKTKHWGFKIELCKKPTRPGSK